LRWRTGCWHQKHLGGRTFFKNQVIIDRLFQLKAGNAKAAMLELEAILEEKLLLEDDEDVN
jgi:hypothetical protein